MRISKPDKEKERYYLLPGQGGRSRRQKVKEMAWWGLLGGAAASMVLAAILYAVSRIGKGAP